MKYKMFTCDLDGTLLNDEHKISEDNLDAIQKLEDNGIKFIIATGRSVHMLEDFLDVLQYKRPIIWSNGAGISNQDGKLIYSKGLSAEKVLEIIKTIKMYSEEYIVYTEDGIIGSNEGERLKFLFEYNKGLKKEHKIPLKIDKNLESNLDNHDILKVSVGSKEKQLLEKIKSEMDHVSGIEAVFSGESILDINHIQASKGDAMVYLANEYNIKPSEIVAIGDNQNDLSMLRKAEISITMESADQQIKDKAMKITTSNNDSGVAKAINDYVTINI